MSAVTVSVNTTWTLVLDLTGKLVQSMDITRESLQTMQIIYSGPNNVPAESDTPEWIVTESAFGLHTGRIPTGGRIWARMTDYAESVEVNYD